MTDQRPQSPDEDFAGYLTKARAEVEAGNYLEGLAFAQKAKGLEPKNIYVLALEKQIEQLVELSAGNALTDEQRTDILESIPGIIDRAVEGPPPEDPDEGQPVTEPEPPSEDNRADREAALEWLKNQYFQHAHDYVRKGEYDNALAEIRRVFIIDPRNTTAKQFEKHILELADLHKEHPAGQVSVEPPPKSPVPPAAESAKPPQARKADQKQTSKPRRRKSTVVIVGIILVAMAFIGYVLIQLWLREDVSMPTTAEPEVLTPQPKIYYQEGQLATEPRPSEPIQPADSLRDSTGARVDTVASSGE
jgi:tetratricopeptide (TPR) repeat protein